MAGLKGITINTAPEAEPHIYAEDDAAIYQSIFGPDGVTNIGQCCKATVLSNNKVRISDGVLFVGGHFARIPYGEYADCEITNGQSGKNRNDIIIAKFVTTGSGGIDTMTCEVKQGTAGATAADPALTQDDIYQSGMIREFPLYRVKIEGLSIVAVEQMFEIVPTNKDLLNKLDELNSNITNSTNYSFSETVWANPTYSIIKKNGRIDISYYCVVSGGVAAKEFPIARLPQGTIPSSAIQFAGWVADTTGNRHAASIKIATTGLISLIAGSNFVEAGFAISYPV